ncbi:PDZ domain-containing protein [Acidobacteriota bacterium]
MFKASKSVMLTVFLSVFLVGTVSASAVGGQSDISEITKKVFPCVVKVEVRNHVRKVATGVILDEDGFIVTTALISPKEEQIHVILSDGRRVEAEFIGMDSETHLAVIRAKEIKVKSIPKGNAEDLTAGAWICVISVSPENRPAVTQGIVSSVGAQGVRLNVHVVPGMSGSPVVDNKGRMMGILRGAYSDEQPIVVEFRERMVTGSGMLLSRAEAPSSGMALAIPIDIVASITSEIKEKGKVERGWLGVSFGENRDGEIEIGVVEKDSPAESAKLKVGDIVIKIEGKELSGPDMLVKEIRMRKPGDKVRIDIERKEKSEKKTIVIDIELGEYTEKYIWENMEKEFPQLFTPEKNRPFRAVPKFEEPGVFKWTFESQKSIGVYLQELNQELADYFGVKEGSGFLISKVDEDSPAKKAGLKPGDVIVGAEGDKVESIDALIDIIQEKEAGETITIEYIRNKKKRRVEVEISEKEGNSELQNNSMFFRKFGENKFDEINVWTDKSGKQIREIFEKKKNSNLRRVDEPTIIKEREKKDLSGRLFGITEQHRSIKV